MHDNAVISVMRWAFPVIFFNWFICSGPYEYQYIQVYIGTIKCITVIVAKVYFSFTCIWSYIYQTK
jgi:hypothetical protein